MKNNYRATFLGGLFAALLLTPASPAQMARDFPAGVLPAKSDFNGDGYGDLAVGAPRQTVNGKVSAGAVNVFYGSSSGLKPGPWFTEDSANCPGSASPLNELCHALACGDFNNDGYADLAIGAPYERFGPISTGVVHVLYGSSTGLKCSGSALLTQESISGGVNEEYDWFGESLAAGDFNFDGFTDLAIGARGDHVAGAGKAGSVSVLYGGPNGLKTAGAQRWTLDSPGILGSAVIGDGFGYSLVAGNFGRGSYADLAIGMPYKQIGTH